MTGGGANLANQLISNGGDLSQVNWTSVGISTIGGGLTGAISGGQARTQSCSVDEALKLADAGITFTENTAQGLANGETLEDSIKGAAVSTVKDFATDQLLTKMAGDYEEKFCFVEGTPVLTAAGLVAIENIKAGDIVIATDEETGETAEKEVVETYINESSELVHLTINGEEITTTPPHPFYVPEKGWTAAIDLKAGDILVLVNGEYVTVEKVEHEILESPINVYNFQVADFHTYHVGEQPVLVHNDGCNSDTDFIVTPSGTTMSTKQDINLVDTQTSTENGGSWFQIHNTHTHNGSSPHTH